MREASVPILGMDRDCGELWAGALGIISKVAQGDFSVKVRCHKKEIFLTVENFGAVDGKIPTSGKISQKWGTHLP